MRIKCEEFAIKAIELDSLKGVKFELDSYSYYIEHFKEFLQKNGLSGKITDNDNHSDGLIRFTID
jgi:hypothetical protein